MPTIAYNDWTKGMNDTAPPDNMEDNEAWLIQNLIVAEGGIKTRLGSVAITKSANGPITQIIEMPLSSGATNLYVIIDKAFCQVNEETGEFTPIQDGLHADVVGWVVYKDKLYILDGDKYYQYNPTDDTPEFTEVTPESETNLDNIKKCTIIVWHPFSHRFFCAGNPDDPAALYYSEPLLPNHFEAESKLYPETALGPIKGLKVFYDAVLVEFKKGWKLWAGTGDPLNSTWTTLAIPNGVASGRSVALTPESLTYYADDGIRIMHAAALNQSASILMDKNVYVNVTQKRMDKTIKSIPQTHQEKAVAVFHDNKYYLAFCDDEDAQVNNKVLVMDWDAKAFVIYAGWNVYDFCARQNGDLIFATDNYLIKTGVGHDDVDVETGEPKPIEYKFESKQYNPGRAILGFYDKRATRAFLSAQQQLSPSSKVLWTVDAGYKEGSADTDMYDSLIWGIRKWGLKWGWTDHVSRQMPMEIDLVGQRFQFKLYANEPSNSFVISAMGLEYEDLPTYKTTEANRDRVLVDDRYFPYPDSKEG